MLQPQSMLIALMGFMLALPCVAEAGVPERIHYQGHLMDSNGEPIHCPQAADNCPSGPVNATFRLYADPDGGAVLWEESKVNIPKVPYAVFIDQNLWDHPDQYFNDLSIKMCFDAHTAHLRTYF